MMEGSLLFCIYQAIRQFSHPLSFSNFYVLFLYVNNFSAHKRKGSRIQEKQKHKHKNNNNNAEEGHYKTTIRPLDGFLQKDKIRKRIKVDDDEEEDDGFIDKEIIEYPLRPTAKPSNLALRLKGQIRSIRKSPPSQNVLPLMQFHLSRIERGKM